MPRSKEETPMQYALLIYHKPGADDGLTEQERQAISAEYTALRGDSRMTGGAKLAPVETATTVRVADDDALVTDGPFAETVEHLAGFVIVEAPDKDAAIELAKAMPARTVEVRPLVEPG
jgi:hypothetical protein